MLIISVIGAAAFIACSTGDDDDDNDAGAADDTAGDDDTADDDTGQGDDDITDDITDDADDDVDDDVDDDSGDDDTAETIGNFLLMLENAKINFGTGGYDYTRCFISTSGTMYIQEIGTTTGSPFTGVLTNVGFTQCEIDWGTGIVQIITDGDTGILDGETLTTTIISVPQALTTGYEPGSKKGTKEEAFHMTEFVQCGGATCAVAGYASISNVFSISEFTNGAYGMNDYALIWQFDGDTTSDTSYDLTIDLPE
jgi:hypothetical protein